MTEMCGAAYLGTEWKRILAFSDHPAAARRPSIEGNLVWRFLSSRESIATVAIQCIAICPRISAGIIYWIATPSAMARNDRDVWGSVSGDRAETLP